MGLKERKQVQSEIPFNIFGAKLRGGAPAKKKKNPCTWNYFGLYFLCFKTKESPTKIVLIMIVTDVIIEWHI